MEEFSMIGKTVSRCRIIGTQMSLRFRFFVLGMKHPDRTCIQEGNITVR